jgi:hypothetical protein
MIEVIGTARVRQGRRADHMRHDHAATVLAAVPDLVDGAPAMHVFEVAP